MMDTLTNAYEGHMIKVVLTGRILMSLEFKLNILKETLALEKLHWPIILKIIHLKQKEKKL